MNFIFNNAEHRITFSHTKDVKGTGRRQRTIRSTIARIYTGERGTDTEQLVTEGQVKLYAKDIFCYETARQGALLKALDGHVRAFRKVAGDTYRLRPRTSGVKTAPVTTTATV